MRTAALLCVAIFCVACPGPTPQPTDAGTDGVDGGGTFCDPTPRFTEDVAACMPLATDYTPRVSGSSTDAWPACVSDANVFTPINPAISTVARVTAFEDIATLLWRDQALPGPQAFLDARVAYAVDQGIDSRVQRREDVHYPAAPSPCSTAGIPEQFPERCAGPTRLLPVLNDAFAKGSRGEAPRVNAARVEAALVWFFYLSALSEVMSCGTRPQDCDSSWAYYCGATPRDQPLGLAKLVRALGVETHDRAYDAELAVRCWRNLDNETGVASDLTRQALARDQLDRALLRGVALIVRQKVAELACTTGDVRDARLAFLNTLAPWLQRAALERDATRGAALIAQLSKTDAAQVDVAATTAALDALFACP